MIIERPMVQKSGVLFLVVLLCALGTLYASSTHYDQQQFKARQSRAQAQSLKQRVQSAAGELSQIQRYLPPYRALKEAGVIGVERRADWVELIGTEARRIGFAKLNFKMEPAIPVSGPWVPDLQTYRPLVSHMSLDMELLHEEDLFQFFRALDEKQENRYSVASCEIKRLPMKLDPHSDKPNLSARCLLLWYALVLEAQEDG